jgi:hypothetical protein
MQALVGAALLLHDPGLDEAIGSHALQFLVELLGRGHPEIGHRSVEALGKVVAGRFALQQGGQYRVT